jgi:hypothetical protein
VNISPLGGQMLGGLMLGGLVGAAWPCCVMFMWCVRLAFMLHDQSPPARFDMTARYRVNKQ